jgi:hypothetical protein
LGVLLRFAVNEVAKASECGYVVVIAVPKRKWRKETWAAVFFLAAVCIKNWQQLLN